MNHMDNTKTKGIYYFTWGENHKDKSHYSGKTAFQMGYKVCNNHISDPEFKKFRNRHLMFENSLFDITCHLDTDTSILANIDFGFKMAEKYGIALCIAPAANAWLAMHKNSLKRFMPVDLPQYNSGVIFFDRTNPEVKEVFEKYSLLLLKYPESDENDQPYLSMAMWLCNFNPYVLPKNWNFRPHLSYVSKAHHGEIKILHSKQFFPNPKPE